MGVILRDDLWRLPTVLCSVRLFFVIFEWWLASFCVCKASNQYDELEPIGVILHGDLWRLFYVV